MGVCRKGRRQILYNDKSYVWYVKEDEEMEGRIMLNVISDDKRMILAYSVGDGTSFVMSKGTFFQGRKTTGCCELYHYPQNPEIVIAPYFVRELIAWTVDGTDAVKIK